MTRPIAPPPSQSENDQATPPEGLSGRLAAAAAAYQAAHVVPHCGQCERPCCRLDTVVLELDWRRLRALWHVRVPRREFDRRLARGLGPKEIRSQGGSYYAYRRVCPAYDPRARRCRVYDRVLKPPGCTDFPVYEEDGRAVADLRCEAVDPDTFEVCLREIAGPDVILERSSNRAFPFLVSYRLVPRRGIRE